MIEVYRFEDEQGNGPWFTRDGESSIFSTKTTEKSYVKLMQVKAFFIPEPCQKQTFAF